MSIVCTMSGISLKHSQQWPSAVYPACSAARIVGRRWWMHPMLMLGVGVDASAAAATLQVLGTGCP